MNGLIKTIEDINVRSVKKHTCDLNTFANTLKWFIEINVNTILIRRIFFVCVDFTIFFLQISGLACPYEKCESRFTHRAALVSHVKKHREDPTALESRSLRCVMEKCGKKFQSRRNLSHHVNKEHRIPEKLGSSSVSSVGMYNSTTYSYNRYC